MKFCIFSIIIFTIFLSGIAESEEMLPIYNLSVSFDIESNLLKGVAQITFPEEGERTISTNNLHIIAVSFNGQPVGFEIKGGALKLSGKGILDITYEGTFKEGFGIENLDN